MTCGSDAFSRDPSCAFQSRCGIFGGGRICGVFRVFRIPPTFSLTKKRPFLVDSPVQQRSGRLLLRKTEVVVLVWSLWQGVGVLFCWTRYWKA